jgi:hypothetical protein
MKPKLSDVHLANSSFPNVGFGSVRHRFCYKAADVPSENSNLDLCQKRHLRVECMKMLHVYVLTVSFCSTPPTLAYAAERRRKGIVKGAGAQRPPPRP